MVSAFSLSTTSSALSSHPKVHFLRSRHDHFDPGSLSLVSPHAHPSLQCLSKNAASFRASTVGGTGADAIELDTSLACFKTTPYTEWPAHFLASLAPLDLELESHAEEVKLLKLKVKDILLDSTKELTDNIQFINSLCRLGVSHHFEDEIEEQLKYIYTTLPKFIGHNDYDLRTVANFFRVLRQYGYPVTCDVFEKFKDGDGKFKKSIANNVNAILCLYEACFLAFPGENVLDEALAFTRKHLKVLAENSSPALQKYIRHVLMYPCNRGIERLDAFHYISYYEEEDESANETLLEFAKLDFNGVQLLYKKELALLSKWSIDANFMEKFPYTRDRIVESYMWAVGCIYEPQYSLSRMMIAKYAQLYSTMDDTYDTHVTFEHLELLTAAIQRLTIDASDGLPKHMKHIFEILLDDLESNGTKGLLFEDSQNNGTCGQSSKTSCFVENIKEIARCYLVEAKWKKEGKAPSFEEYMVIARVTCVLEVITLPFILWTETMGMKEILWLQNQPEMAIAARYIGRLLNDITGITDEKQRQDFPKAVHCYMEQYAVSQDEAVEAIKKIIENKWKVMNEEMTKTSHIPRILRKCILNYCRMTLVMNGGVIDTFTYSTNLRQLIESMLFEPFLV